MEAWEYNVLTIDMEDADELIARLNGPGSDGWELVSVFVFTGSVHGFAFFKRQKQVTPPDVPLPLSESGAT